jgi:DNA uptake protein ComE-like DNA-binding protein
MAKEFDAPPLPPPREPPAERSNLVDINTASLAQLDRLGAGRIGRAIIRGRPYADTEDLVDKRVLRRATYERIREKIAAR